MRNRALENFIGSLFLLVEYESASTASHLFFYSSALSSPACFSRTRHATESLLSMCYTEIISEYH